MSYKSILDKYVRSVIGGVLAFVISFVIIYQLTYNSLGTVRESVLGGSFAADAPSWELVGWIFYNAHFAPVSGDLGGVFENGSGNVISASTILGAELYVIPAALLLIFGYFAARTYDADDFGDTVTMGPAIALGYLPLAIAGTFLFVITGDGSTAGPDVVLSVGYAGLVYPLVFGTIGALLARNTALPEQRPETA